MAADDAVNMLILVILSSSCVVGDCLLAVKSRKSSPLWTEFVIFCVLVKMASVLPTISGASSGSSPRTYILPTRPSANGSIVILWPLTPHIEDCVVVPSCGWYDIRMHQN